MIGIATREPYKVSTTASCPLPSASNWCPGRIERNVSSSGAPRKIEGMKSINVCVIDIAAMKTTNIIGEIVEEAKEKRRREATRFIWIPGARPVKVPADTPSNKAIKISIIIF